MSIDRTSTPLPPDTPSPALLPQAEVTNAIRLQILSTEHWSLLATRSMAWNEVFARAGMQLSALSGAIVALALVGQGSGFGEPFLLFGIVIMPVVLLVGIGAFLRLSRSNQIDATCVLGMNRIRAAYLQFAPDLEPYFVTGASDDMAGIARTLGEPLAPAGLSAAALLSATPTLVALVNAVVAGALAAFILLELHVAAAAALGAGVVVFGGAFAAHGRYARGRVSAYKAAMAPRFPRPSGDDAPPQAEHR